MRVLRVSLILVALLAQAGCARARGTPSHSPSVVADELLAADQAFAAAAASREMADALGAMFADDVIMPLPGGRFAATREEALTALRANPLNVGARVTWSPIRAGVSADGLHGFTFGYFTQTRPDTVIEQKYMTYWVRGENGWRAAAFKRGRRPPGATTPAMPPALPPRAVAVSHDAAAIDAFRASLAAAERGFSDEAQRVGIGPAFEANGSDDAVNFGLGSEFLVGARAIGRAVGGDGPATPSPVSWDAGYRVLVASSGDLGITFGLIRSNSGEGPAQPFFTIWRRETVRHPWRYIAE